MQTPPEIDERLPPTPDFNDPPQTRLDTPVPVTDYETLKCSICLDIYSIPHILECGHSYCFLCLWSWLGINKKCPECRIPVMNKPIRNLALENTIEAIYGIPERIRIEKRIYTDSNRSFLWHKRYYEMVSTPISISYGPIYYYQD